MPFAAEHMLRHHHRLVVREEAKIAGNWSWSVGRVSENTQGDWVA
jgi:hypothetical protein